MISWFFRVVMTVILLVCLYLMMSFARSVDVTFGNYHVSIPTVLLFIFLILGVGLSFLVGRFFGGVRGRLVCYRYARRSKKDQQGFKYFTHAFVSFVLGHYEKSSSLLANAEKVLGYAHPVFTLLSSLLAEKQSDLPRAKRDYVLLLNDNATAPIGFVGLLQHPDQSDIHVEKLIQLVETRYADNALCYEAVIKYYLAGQDYDRVLELLKQDRKFLFFTGVLSKDLVKRYYAEACYGKALQYHHEGNQDAALDWLFKSLDGQMAHEPTIRLIFQIYNDLERFQEADSFLTKYYKKVAWSADLIALYQDMVAGQKPLIKMQKIKKLVTSKGREKLIPPKIRLALAQVALEAEVWGEAKYHLNLLLEQGYATPKVCLLLAKIDEHEGKHRYDYWLQQSALLSDKKILAS